LDTTTNKCATVVHKYSSSDVELGRCHVTRNRAISVNQYESGSIPVSEFLYRELNEIHPRPDQPTPALWFHMHNACIYTLWHCGNYCIYNMKFEYMD